MTKDDPGPSTLRVALFLSLITTATFGVFSGQFGLYNDDFPSWYVYLTSGTKSLVDLAGGQGRPLVGLLPELARTVAGSHRLMWLVFTTNGLLVFLILRLLWPGERVASALAAALVCVYPLFWLRPLHIALAIELSLCMALLSHWIGLRCQEQRGWRRAAATSASAALVVGYLLLYELPVGLELIRPALLAIRLRHLDRLSARGLLRSWAPWLLVFLALAAWRLFVFQLSGDYERLQYNAVKAPAWSAVVKLGLTPWKMIVDTWVHQLRGVVWPAEPSDMLLVGICALAGILCLWRFQDGARRESGFTPPRWHPAVEMAVVGLGILVAGQVGPFLTGSVSELSGLMSRWTHSSVLGVSLVWTALITGGAHRVRRPRLGQALLLGMIGLGALFHIQNARDFIRDWERQRQLFWQLAWRAPSLEPGVLLVLDRAYRNAQDRDIPEYVETMSADLFFDGGQRVAATTARQARAAGSNPRQIALWGLVWQADPARALLVHASRGCVEVVSERRLPTGKRVSRAARIFVPSASELIREEPSPPPAFRFLFEPEPPRDWCYFYQRALLAEQFGHTEEIVRLGGEAWDRGLGPTLRSEWNVFRRAFRRTSGRAFPPEPR